MSRAASAVALMTLLGVSTPHAQNPQTPRERPSGTALVVGQVIDAHTSRGIPGAVVSLSGGADEPDEPGVPPSQNRGAVSERVLATGDGRFVFRNLPAGTYRVTARKPGYIDGAYGRRIPAGATRQLVLAEGGRNGDIDIQMWKHGAISGTVLDEAGEPVVGIQVRAMRRAIVAGRAGFTPAASTRTDDRGMYRLPALTPGDYVVAVVSIQVAVPAATIQGLRRLIEARDPQGTVGLRSLAEAGARTAQPGSPGSVQVGDMVQTIGRSAIPPPPAADGTMFVYPTMFFPPAGPSAATELVTVKSGEERLGADFQLRPVPATSIAGLVVGPEGPVPGVIMRLTSPETEQFATDLYAATTVSGSDGQFTFLAVPAGTYTLEAERAQRFMITGGPPTVIQAGSGMTIMTSGPPEQRGAPELSDEPTLWAHLPVAVDGRPLTGIEVPLQVGGHLSGHVVFEGAGPRPEGDELTRIAVRAQAADGGLTRIPILRVDRSGRFRSPGLPGGKYVLRAGGAPAGWTFKEARVDGRDVSDVPLEVGSSDIDSIVIAFTNRPATLAGTVRTAQGAPDPDATVLVFPSDREMWMGYGAWGRRFRSARAGTTGAYSIAGLPPGRYAVIARPDEATADWQDPGNLETLLRAAARLEIADQQTRTQDLTTNR